MKKITLFLILFLLLGNFIPVKAKAGSPGPEKPKIVIGIVVDQMRWDFLYKFRDRYGDGGFNRLLNQGFSCDNTFIRHVPTATAPGHSSIYTGSVPAVNGIIENSWYDRSRGREISNVADTTVRILGEKDQEGRSPRNLLTTTIGDELRIATNFQSKVVGVAIKDRASILPAGHTANAAFWYSGGRFTSSTYYMEKLPDWVNTFNNTDWEGKLMPDGWKTYYPIDTYKLSEPDNQEYERSIGKGAPVFPYKEVSLTSTPFGNTYTFEFAKAAIEGYHLGEGKFTDMLTVSLSTPDRIGHSYGPNSIEQEDDYIRLDKDFELFFNYLDKRYGKNNYLLFLSADHGGNQASGFLEKYRIPTGNIDEKAISKELGEALQQEYGTTKLILAISGGNVYLNDKEISKRGLEKKQVAKFIIAVFKKIPGIENAFLGEKLATATLPEPEKTMYINGYYPKRSGDIVLLWSAGWKPGSPKGADHGNWYPYDAHIPLVWMGTGIPHGRTHRNIGQTDIAPTIAALLDIQMPSGTVGKVITEITDL